MGRWAFFSTGYEYKFWFATQSSADIRLFGGTPLVPPHANMANSNLYHVWTSAEDVWDHLIAQYLADASGAARAWASKFPLTLEGTEQMRLGFERGAAAPIAAAKAALGGGVPEPKVLLGLLIWHQLQYCPEGLYARYEQ